MVDMSKETTLDQYYDPNLLFGCVFVWIARPECRTQTDTAIRHRWKPCTHYSSHHPKFLTWCLTGKAQLLALISSARQWKSHFQKAVLRKVKGDQKHLSEPELPCWVGQAHSLIEGGQRTRLCCGVKLSETTRNTPRCQWRMSYQFSLFLHLRRTFRTGISVITA